MLALLSRHVAMHRSGDDPSRWMFEATPGQPPHQNAVIYPWRQILTEVLPILADHVRTNEALWVSDLQVTSLYTLKRNSTTSPSRIT